MKITFVIYSLGAGGAEKVMTTLANTLAERAYKVSIITIDGNQQFYPLSEKVNLIHLNSANKSGSNNILRRITQVIQRINNLTKAIKATNPDLVVSFMTETNILSVLACNRLKIPVIVSERTNPAIHYTPKVTKQLRNIFYKKASAIVTQTETTKAFYKNLIQNTPIFVIANPILLSEYRPDRSQSENIILNIGRLSYEKGQLALIDAYAASKAKDNWKLWIIGEGPERTTLQQRIDEYELAGNISLLGKKEDVKPYFNKAGIYILSSLYEGFPNALLEAMAMELPCISTDCETGPGEIIVHNQNGLLVPTGSIEALTNAIDQLCNNHQVRSAFTQTARKTILPYDSMNIVSSWEKVFQDTLSVS